MNTGRLRLELGLCIRQKVSRRMEGGRCPEAIFQGLKLQQETVLVDL
jgi:hypothetical protein